MRHGPQILKAATITVATAALCAGSVTAAFAQPYPSSDQYDQARQNYNQNADTYQSQQNDYQSKDADYGAYARRYGAYRGYYGYSTSPSYRGSNYDTTTTYVTPAEPDRGYYGYST